MNSLKFQESGQFLESEWMKPEIQRIHISGCRCNERLKPKTDGSKDLGYIGSFDGSRDDFITVEV